MGHHFISLLGRSWHAMTSATSTNTLGFILWTVALAIVSWAATVAEKWRRLAKEKRSSPFREALSDSLWTGVYLSIGIGVLVLMALGVSTPSNSPQ